MQEQDIPRAPTRVAMLTERAEGEPRAETRGVPVSAYQLTEIQEKPIIGVRQEDS